MSVFVKGPGTVTFNDKVYHAGEAIEGLSKEDEKALLEANAVQTQPLDEGESPNLVPTSEEVAQTIAEMEKKPNPSSKDLEVK